MIIELGVQSCLHFVGKLFLFLFFNHKSFVAELPSERMIYRPADIVHTVTEFDRFTNI